jgi:hypothetical protein
MQFYFSGGAIEADNKGVARTKALNIIPSTGQPGFLYLSFLPMASTARPAAVGACRAKAGRAGQASLRPIYQCDVLTMRRFDGCSGPERSRPSRD